MTQMIFDEWIANKWSGREPDAAGAQAHLAGVSGAESISTIKLNGGRTRPNN
jgi:hypothetical protein